MPVGMQVWGPDSKLWVDTNTRLGRLYGEATIGPSNGSVALPQLASQGVPFVLQSEAIMEEFTAGGFSTRVPWTAICSFSGNTLSWVFPFQGATANATANVYYGAY